MANLFKQAAQKTAAEAKTTKPKGTVIELPKELDTGGKLTGDSAKLHQAVADLLIGSSEEKAAKNKQNLAKGTLGRFAHPEIVRRIAKDGQVPPGPIKFVDHKGQSVTYVIQDKSQQYALKDDQVSDLRDLLGEEAANEVMVTEEVYAFNPDTMNEPLAGGEGTVADVVFEIVSKAVERNTKLSDAQKAALIRQDVVTKLKAGFANAAALHCGKDAGRIEDAFDILKSQVVRYVKS